MGIVIRQSFFNTFILFLGFAIGGINILFLYTNFLHEDYFGLIIFLLSTGNLLLPLIVFGMQHTIVKFFSTYKTKLEQDGFLTSAIFLPLLVIIPLAGIGSIAYTSISEWLSEENQLIKNYTYLIFFIALFMGYFELFYAWTKVHLKTVFGSFIKEIFARISVSVLLILVYLEQLSQEQFIYAVVVVYGIRTLIMAVFAFRVYKPNFIFGLPENIKEIVSFSFYMIVAGSAGGILLEIDKVMIPQMEQIAQVAYYSVGIYIASVVGIPNRAMQQITSPITARDINENNFKEVSSLYKQTSINLLVIGGLLFLIINLNVSDLYILINKPEFSRGYWIVLIVSIAKLIELALGTGNAILVNSKYYKMFFYLSISMAITVVVLNRWLIELFKINGAALATLIVVFVFSAIKILYIKKRFKIIPFGLRTIKILAIIGGLYAAFRFWNFTFHPIINIGLKSGIIIVLYLVLVKWMNVSREIDKVIVKYLNRE